MKILLQQDVRGMGRKGEVVEVKDGYARNFVIPNGIGVEATGGALKQSQNEKQAEVRKKVRENEESEILAAKMKSVTVVLKHKAGDEGRLFGSVTSQEVAEGLQALGYAVDKKKVSLDEPIRHLGRYQVHLKLSAKVNAEISVQVDKL